MSKERLSKQGRANISAAAKKKWREYRIGKLMRDEGISRRAAMARLRKAGRL